MHARFHRSSNISYFFYTLIKARGRRENTFCEISPSSSSPYPWIFSHPRGSTSLSLCHPSHAYILPELQLPSNVPLRCQPCLALCRWHTASGGRANRENRRKKTLRLLQTEVVNGNRIGLHWPTRGGLSYSQTIQLICQGDLMCSSLSPVICTCLVLFKEGRLSMQRDECPLLSTTETIF